MRYSDSQELMQTILTKLVLMRICQKLRIQVEMNLCNLTQICQKLRTQSLLEMNLCNLTHNLFLQQQIMILIYLVLLLLQKECQLRWFLMNCLIKMYHLLNYHVPRCQST